jgi:hypothetical protein
LGNREEHPDLRADPMTSVAAECSPPSPLVTPGHQSIV